jgi:hypothetical protein
MEGLDTSPFELQNSQLYYLCQNVSIISCKNLKTEGTFDCVFFYHNNNNNQAF